MKSLKYIVILALGFVYSSCEDPVDVDSNFEKPQLVVDGWIDNLPQTQTITLTESQSYYDNRLPTAVTDASVVVTNGLTVFSFVHTKDGKYVWTPSTTMETLGAVGDEFALSITRGDQEYVATSQINRVPEIDSIKIYFEDETIGDNDGLYAEMYARDFDGLGDTYWIKGLRNDTLLTRPRELIIAYDFAFDPGLEPEGRTFIRPLRFGINAVDENGAPIPLSSGDKVGAEVHSITNEAFLFLSIVQEQVNNGDNNLFALPVANARSNVFNAATGEAILGFFNVAAVSKSEKIVE